MNIDERSLEFLADLAPPQRVDTLQGLADHVARTLDRTIVIRELPLSAHRVIAPTGLWIAEPASKDRPATDWVVVDSSMSEFHKAITVGHELAHILWDHGPTPLLDLDDDISPETIAALTGQQPTAGVAVLGRCGVERFPQWSPEWLDEAEAETLGRMLVEPLIDGPEDRLTQVFDGRPRRRWPRSRVRGVARLMRRARVKLCGHDQPTRRYPASAAGASTPAAPMPAWGFSPAPFTSPET